MAEKKKAPLLYDELTLVEKTYLGNMSQHPGFPVLKKLMEGACIRTKDDVIKLDPQDDDYMRKLAALQQASRVINDFCAQVINSVRFHVETAVVELAQQKADEEINNVLANANQ